MPSAPSARLGLTSPLTTEAAAGPANIATLITQLEAAVGMVRLGEVTSAGGAGAGIAFAAINQNFRHLQVRGVLRSNLAAGNVTDPLLARFNGSSAAVYDTRSWSSLSLATVGADGAGIATASSAAATSAALGAIAAEGVGGDVPVAVTGFTLDIYDYTSAAWKTWVYQSARVTTPGVGVGAEIVRSGGGWRSTAAITDLSLFVASAGLDAISRATLYGLR